MSGPINQRWRDGVASYRPLDPIDTSAYEVAEISSDKVAKDFVERHHYSRSYPAARHRFGLYRRHELVGVAVFSHPPSEDVLAKLPCERLAGVELGRFVLLDDVPGNGESWFLARCFEGLRRKGVACLLSHSDPLPRRAANGNVVMPGHVGTIYQATNAVYAGRTRASKLSVLPDGTVFGERSMSKLRSAERGWEREVERLIEAGAPAPHARLTTWRDRRDWMWAAIAATCRRVHHGGNHRYLWALDRRLRRDVAKLATGAYPKTVDEAAA